MNIRILEYRPHMVYVNLHQSIDRDSMLFDLRMGILMFNVNEVFDEGVDVRSGVAIFVPALKSGQFIPPSCVLRTHKDKRYAVIHVF